MNSKVYILELEQEIMDLSRDLGYSRGLYDMQQVRYEALEDALDKQGRELVRRKSEIQELRTALLEAMEWKL